MDRRQQKTRKAIFRAFRSLLEKKRYDHITVQEILDEADVGRSTFYAHFETKEMLLEAMCREVIFQVFEQDPCPWVGRDEDPVGRLAHILWHVRDSRRDLTAILLSDSGDVFMGYFRRHLRHLFEAQMPALREDLPRDFLLYQLSVGFSETVKWWVADNFKNTPEEVADWFWRLYSGEK
jgi:AcrR family transcriptional regulator